jgi:hypothetical protein
VTLGYYFSRTYGLIILINRSRDLPAMRLLLQVVFLADQILLLVGRQVPSPKLVIGPELPQAGFISFPRNDLGGPVNLEGEKYLRGMLYKLEKKQGERKDLTCDQNDRKSEKAAEKIAKETGVSPATIRRDAKFTETVDSLSRGLILPWGGG